MARVFISYRRADSQAIVGRVYDRLVTAFGRQNVFKDVNVIPPGSTFRDVIQKELNRCTVLLVIIGPQWASISDSKGRRLDNPDDWVRQEVTAGLQRAAIRVIPVLVDNATMPDKSSLPPDVQPLCDRQAAVLRHDPDFDHDMGLLIHQMERPRRWKWIAALAALLAALIFLCPFISPFPCHWVNDFAALFSASTRSPSGTSPAAEGPPLTTEEAAAAPQPGTEETASLSEGTIQGHLLWNDQPAAGVEVRLTTNDGGFYLGKTDEQGYYSLVVPLGEYMMYYRFPNSVSWVPGQSTPYFSQFPYAPWPAVAEAGKITSLDTIHTIKQNDLQVLTPSTAQVSSAQPLYSWADYPAADHYEVWVYESHVSDQGVPYAYPAGSPASTLDTSIVMDWPLLELTEYYAWVIAYNANDHELADGYSTSFRYIAAGQNSPTATSVATAGLTDLESTQNELHQVEQKVLNAEQGVWIPTPQGVFQPSVASMLYDLEKINYAPPASPADSQMASGREYLVAGRYNDSFTAYQDAAKLDQDNPEPDFWMGLLIPATGGPPEVAILLLGDAIEKDTSPEQVIALFAYRQRGIFYLTNGDPDAALADFSKCIEVGGARQQTTPTFWQVVYVNRGITYQFLGRTLDALHDYDQALELAALEPNPPVVARIQQLINTIDAALDSPNVG